MMTMILGSAHPPSTPVHERHEKQSPPFLNRRLWSSPAFSQHSDYYSGDDGGSGTFSPDSELSAYHHKMAMSAAASIAANPTTAKDTAPLPPLIPLIPFGLSLSLPSPLRNGGGPESSLAPQKQRMMLDRLNGIARAILASPNLTEHHFQILEVDIDRLEQTLAAPDSQSREPADIAENGLFDDDDDDDDEDEDNEEGYTNDNYDEANNSDEELQEVRKQEAENEEDDDATEIAPDSVQEPIPFAEDANFLVAQVLQGTEYLKQRLQEMKNLYATAEVKIQRLQNEVAEQDQRYSEMYDEVSQYHTDFLYLKLSLKSLEVRVDTDMSPTIRAQFLVEIDRWKMQWKISTEILRARRLRKRSKDASCDDDSSSVRSWTSFRAKPLLNGSPISSTATSSNADSGSSPSILNSPRTPRTPTRILAQLQVHMNASRRIVSDPSPSLISHVESYEPDEIESKPILPLFIQTQEPIKEQCTYDDDAVSVNKNPYIQDKDRLELVEVSETDLKPASTLEPATSLEPAFEMHPKPEEPVVELASEPKSESESESEVEQRTIADKGEVSLWEKLYNDLAELAGFRDIND